MRASGSFFILESRWGGEADYHAIEIVPQWFPGYNYCNLHSSHFASIEGYLRLCSWLRNDTNIWWKSSWGWGLPAVNITATCTQRSHCVLLYLGMSIRWNISLKLSEFRNNSALHVQIKSLYVERHTVKSPRMWTPFVLRKKNLIIHSKTFIKISSPQRKILNWFFRDKISCYPGWPQTHYVTKAAFELLILQSPLPEW